MKYPIHTGSFSDNQLQVEVSGLFSRPDVLFEDEPVQRSYAKKNTFNFNDSEHHQHELRITLPWLDPVIRVDLDGATLKLNTQHSLKARSAIFVPLGVMFFSLVLGTFWPWLGIGLLLPLSLLAVKAMRLNHFSKKRKLVLVAAMLTPLTLLAAAAWTGIQQQWESRIPKDAIAQYVFYEVVLNSDEFAVIPRQGVVDLLDAFRTTQAFESVELDLSELPLAPELEVSISQSFYPKLDRDVWVVRFDFTTAELGVRDSQSFANEVGRRFEQFLNTIERQQPD